MNALKGMNKPQRKEDLFCGAAAVLFPTAIFTYFCAKNVNELMQLWVAFLAIGIIVVISAIAFIAIRLLLRSAFLALTFCTVCWLGCYLQWPLFNAVLVPLKIYHPHLLLYTPCIILVAGIAVAVIKKAGIQTKKFSTLFFAFSALLFLFNLLPLTWAAIQRQYAERTDWTVKTDFNISQNGDLPSIFWIHTDGMLGIDATERYFHEAQNEFLEGLTDQGFAMNASARFEAACKTGVAIPELTSPYAYDNWISTHMQSHEDAIEFIRSSLTLSRMAVLRKNNELLNAFFEKGYETSVIGMIGDYYPPIGGIAYSDLGEEKPQSLIHFNAEISRCREALETMDTLSSLSKYFDIVFEYVFDRYYETNVLAKVYENYSEPFETDASDVQAMIPKNFLGDNSYLWEALCEALYARYQGAQFTVVHDLTPHYPFKYNADGSTHESTMNPLDYYPQHVWSSKILIEMVDMILAVDPDAIIVIQADHGLHGNEEKEFKAAFGEDADAVELWNSTMSAIRVPEKYQNDELHYALENPLNISRWLVNSFVGRNYDYLPANN